MNEKMNEAVDRAKNQSDRHIRYRVLLEKSIPLIRVRIYEPWYTPRLN